MDFFVAIYASEFEHEFRNMECHGSSKKMEIHVSRLQYVRTVNYVSLGRTHGKETPRKCRSW
jgi:hypothetical protein